MIHFIDQTSVADHHMVFNASMVSVLLRMYPTETIVLHGIASNQQSMFEFFSEHEKKRIKQLPIEYSKPLSQNILFKGLNYILKEHKRRKLINHLFQTVDSTDLVFLSITTFTCLHHFVKTKMKYSVPTLTCLHGDIDFLYNAQNKMERLMAKTYKKLLKYSPENFKYILLNKISKPILIKDGFLNTENVIDIEHPYIDLELNKLPLNLSNKPITIAHIGSMEVKRKNSHFTYQLAELLADKIVKNDLNIQSIGLITPSVVPYKNDLVKEIVGNEETNKPKYLTRTQYEQALSKIHYTVFFYPINEYVFRASGATVDTISFEKPILTLRHPYFEYLFRKAGNVGYMFETLDEMKDKITAIAAYPSDFEQEYEIQCKNLRNFKNNLTINGICEDLKIQLVRFRNK